MKNKNLIWLGIIENEKKKKCGRKKICSEEDHQWIKKKIVDDSMVLEKIAYQFTEEKGIKISKETISICLNFFF